MKTFSWRKALAVLPVLAVMAVGQTTVTWDGLKGIAAWDTTWYTKSKSSASFKISTASQLAGLAQLVSGYGYTMSGKTFTLTGDVALNATDQQGWQQNSANEWMAIGTRAKPFQGTFDGGGFTVRGVYIPSGDECQGLFGYVNKMGKINKLRVAESKIVGSSYVGGLVGSDSGTITDSYSTADVTGSGDYVGGLAGYINARGSITNSYATGEVSGRSFVGGLVGAGVRDTIRGGYATGKVKGSGGHVGGLVGYSNGGYIINSYATGNVEGGGSYIGGLAGRSENMTVAGSGNTKTVYLSNIVNSYAAGNVKGVGSVGGLVGFKSGSAIRNCYAAGEVTGNDLVGGLVGETGDKTTITYGYYAADAGSAGGCAEDDDDCVADNGLVSRGPGIPKAGKYMKSEKFVSLLNVAAYALKNNSLKENTNKWYYLDGQFPKLSIDSVTAAIFASCFFGGDGTSARPFLIKDRQHLENLAVYVNCGATLSGKFFKQIDDIFVADTANWRSWRGGNENNRFGPIDTLSGMISEWTAIGQQPSDTSGQPPVRFNGTFDGGGFAVYGVYINKYADSTLSGRYQGLFGRVEREGTQGGDIKNLGVAYSYINAYSYAGGLAGWNKKGSITRSYVKNARIEAWGGRNGAGGIGGLLGLNDSAGVVINSYASADVFGEINMAGGLVGWNSANSKISYCHAKEDEEGKVDVIGDDAGGLVGRNDGSAIRNSYAAVSVLAAGDASGKGGNVIGGLVGMNFNATVAKCYSVGKVSGNSSVGGLVGAKMSNGKVDSSYYRGDTSTIKNDYGTPLPDSLMRGFGAAAIDSVYKGWDFEKVWDTEKEFRSYPYLGMRRAARPVITEEPKGKKVNAGDRLVLYVNATVPAGDTISFQWYSNDVDTNANGVKIGGASGREFSVPTGEDTLLYYYAVVTNTSAPAPDSVAGSRTASVASKTAKVIVGDRPDAVLSSGRVVPEPASDKEVAAISPAPALTAELTAGPNPASKSSGAVNFFRSGKRIAAATLYVFDASGSAVKKIKISDAAPSRPNRKVGAWDLTDAKGRPVSAGAYAVKGAITSDGKRESVSIIVGVVR